MKWSVNRTALPAFLRVAIEGKPSRAEYLALCDEVVTDKGWKPGTSVFFDITRRDPMGLEAHDITKALADYFVRNKAIIGKMVIAIWSRDTQTYQYNRMFEYSVRMRNSPVAVRTFSDEHDAVAWLEMIYSEEHNEERFAMTG